VPKHAVLIVGAGPTGLVLAIELARRGVPFHLIDRLKQPVKWDRAIFIKSRSMEVLAGLGLADRFLQGGNLVQGIDLFSGAARVAGYRFSVLDTPYPYIVSIPEDETESILTAHLESLGGRVERGVEFVGLDQIESGVRVRLRSEGAGERVLEANWVVGTDGLHSGVREAVGDAFEGHDYPRLWGVVDSRISGWRHPREITCPQLQEPVVIPFPLGADKWRIYFRADSPDASLVNMVGERIALGLPGATLQDTEEPQFFHAHSRVAHRYRIGRVLLAGDAAHASNPFEGHGMNSGIQDAYNLGWKLALVISEKSPPSLIDSYEAERRPVGQAIIESGDAAEARIFSSAEEPKRELFAFLSTPEGQACAAMSEAELDFVYSNSPIVAEFASTQPAPPATAIGCRVGDASDLVGPNGGTRLHQLIAVPEHTLLFLLGDSAPAETGEALALLDAVAARHPGCLRGYAVTQTLSVSDEGTDRLLWDQSGKLHERLGAQGPMLCLIRPDGHLGFRCAPPSLATLTGYLKRLFV
jgi:2-polyprenyl-6-methoxyphenol hydroxylase-like FAD-dependent oxidoreductase